MPSYFCKSKGSARGARGWLGVVCFAKCGRTSTKCSKKYGVRRQSSIKANRQPRWYVHLTCKKGWNKVTQFLYVKEGEEKWLFLMSN